MEPPRDERVPDAAEQESAEQLPLIELETLLTRRPSRRKRLAHVALMLGVVALAAVALRGVILPPGLSANIPAPPQVPITLLSNVNFGTVTINGTRLNKPPPLTISIPVKGTTIITLNAPPFRPSTCRFTNLTAPLADPIHCAFDYEHLTPNTSSATSGGFVVGIYLMPDNLPADQQSQALAAMSLPLGAPQQTMVHPGEYIATSYRYEDQIISQRATVPLLARASFEPSQLPGPPSGPNCGAGICPWGVYLSQATALDLHAWSLFFTEALHWQISDTAGVVRADVSIPSTDIIGVLLTEDTAAGWEIAQLNTIYGTLRDTICQAGVAMLRFRLSGNVTVLHDQGVEGCELRGQVNGVGVGRYIWRFGVLLAANAQAHAYQPDLPLAPAAEIAAVGA